MFLQLKLSSSYYYLMRGCDQFSAIYPTRCLNIDDVPGCSHYKESAVNTNKSLYIKSLYFRDRYR